MLMEAILFIVACITVVLAFIRKPKYEMPEEVKVLEEEVKKWLESPTNIPLTTHAPTTTSDSTKILFKEPLGYAHELSIPVYRVAEREEMRYWQ